VNEHEIGDRLVNDEIPIAPLIYDGLDPVPKSKPVISEVIDVLEEAARHVKRSFEAARRPGMPLSVLSNIAREAPLGSLLIAFLLGVAVGRRRVR
jgi:hypothetical protein